MTLGATLSQKARTFAANRMLDLAVVLWFLMCKRTSIGPTARRLRSARPFIVGSAHG